MAPTLRDQILGKDDLPTREVKVPEWGITVHVAMLTAGERDRLETAFQDARARGVDMRALVAVDCLCEPDRRRLFTRDDIGELSRKSGLALERISTAALKFNRMTVQDVAELEKNSAAGP